MFFIGADGSGRSLFRVRLDGTARQRTSTLRRYVLGTISPDGQWISTTGAGGAMKAVSTTGGTVPILPGVSRLRWSPDGTRVYIAVQYEDAAAFGTGRTYVLPLAKGTVLPSVPPGGFRSEAELAAVPGVEILP